MDWSLAIARNSTALLALANQLLMLAGLESGCALTTLPRSIYTKILRLLRPAEAAVRRLILIMAYEQMGSIAPSVSTKTLKKNTNWWNNLKNTPQTHMRFALIEPMKRVCHHRFVPITCPPPRISVPGYYDPVFAVQSVSTHDEMIIAQFLGRRILALKAALEDLPRQAKRLARWQARRRLKASTQRRSPIRQTHPPCARARQRHAVDAILIECHALMRDKLANQKKSQDTS